MSTFDTIVNGLNARRSGAGWSARCPAHDDQHASLSLSEGDCGKPLVCCHAGCSQEQVIDALKGRGLWPGHSDASRRVVARYDYRDETGKLLYQVERYYPKSFRQRRPDGLGGWVYNLDGVRRVPYRLPELRSANGEQAVFLVEGEKDADNLTKMGLVATTNPGGAGKWRDEYTRCLAGRDVVIVTDNDETGRRHGLRVATSLLDVARSVRIIDLSDLPPKADITDWIQAGGTKKQLLALVSAAKPISKQDLAAKLSPNSVSVWKSAISVDAFLSSTDADVIYLVKNVIARESVTVLAAPRGLGKTHLACFWAILLARLGYRVLLIDRDNPKAEIKRRMRAWGASGLGAKLKVLARDEAPPLTDKAAWLAFPYADYDFVILDSISAATEGVEERDGGRAGAGLAPLLDAARRGPAVLMLANTTKDGVKVRGSGTLSDRADIVFEVRDATDLKVDAKHSTWWDALPDCGEHAWSDRAKRRRRRDSYRLALVTSKFRLGEEPNPICFEIRHDTDPWTVEDVTQQLEEQLEAAKRAAADADQKKMDLAVAALIAKLPMPKNPDALQLLQDHGLSRNEARRLLADRANRDWVVKGSGTKNDPYILESAAGNRYLQSPCGPRSACSPIPAALVPQWRQETMIRNASPPVVSESSDSCQSLSGEGLDREVL